MAKLELWHPPLHTRIENQDVDEKGYRRDGPDSILCPTQIGEKHLSAMRWILTLLENTASRQPNFACHGLHEWAMVYRGHEVRHEATLSLRLSQDQIDAFVKSRSICCSHYDAFRFFAPQATSFNRMQPSFETREQNEQPACLHANMDLYKWAYRCMPYIGSDLLIDCFELALEIRAMDMRASPYDLSGWGYAPIKIETPDGRREYELLQKKYAISAQNLRERLISCLQELPRTQ